MSDIIFRGKEISTIPLYNRPSYMKQNSYGHVTYIPVLAPALDVTESELKNSKDLTIIKSQDRIIDMFMEQYSETSGSLKDHIEVSFMGYRYEYHPSHLTRYGKLARQYILLPIMVRWAIANGIDANKFITTDPSGLPKDYKEGTAAGFSIYLSEDFNSPQPDVPQVSSVNKDTGALTFIPLMKKHSPLYSIKIANSIPDSVNEAIEWVEKHQELHIDLPDQVGLEPFGIKFVDAQHSKIEGYVYATLNDYEAGNRRDKPLIKINNLTIRCVSASTLSDAKNYIMSRF